MTNTPGITISRELAGTRIEGARQPDVHAVLAALIGVLQPVSAACADAP